MNINIPILQDNLDAVDYFVGYDKKWLDWGNGKLWSVFLFVILQPAEKNIFILNVYPSRARWIICKVGLFATYRIALYFRGTNFSRIAMTEWFRGIIFEVQ